MKKYMIVLLLFVAVMNPDTASAAGKSRGYSQKPLTSGKIVEGGFEATGRVTEGIFNATDNILLAVLSVPLLPLYILNEALTADSDNNKQNYYSSGTYSSHSKSNTSRRNVKAGDRVWKEYR